MAVTIAMLEVNLRVDSRKHC